MEPSSPVREAQPGGSGTAGQPQASSAQPIHKRSFNSGGGLFSKFSFARRDSDAHNSNPSNKHAPYQPQLSPHEPSDDKEPTSPKSTSTAAPTPTPQIIVAPLPRQPPSIASALQQQKTRRRRGSLRKVALLGRGAQRERREANRANLSIDIKQAESWASDPMSNEAQQKTDAGSTGSTGLGLGISDATPRPSMDGYARRPLNTASAVAAAQFLNSAATTTSYTTTDDEDALLMRRNTQSRAAPALTSLSSGSDSFFGRIESVPRRRPTLSRARSPLVAATSLLTAVEDDWDYSETEWWGWVIFLVTWVVFVVGMGSVFGVWSWAWDVGTTPYAPPELEDDPTLPITGYYPCLMILTCVMAWVWVVSAWVGMKYFRHAKISGD
ncbi:hypothetical protein BD289DRAFT_463154 [Coniella lustricola]|uniref:Uncharacterized protein n=1 Tax=Coniella lustricola TaxID=2025994 RepID=A0A2T2ZX74_9PEZI|nr:hypothetical protein BD289DRAFT_463154 [Coniella lustricola]